MSNPIAKTGAAGNVEKSPNMYRVGAHSNYNDIYSMNMISTCYTV